MPWEEVGVGEKTDVGVAGGVGEEPTVGVGVEGGKTTGGVGVGVPGRYVGVTVMKGKSTIASP